MSMALTGHLVAEAALEQVSARSPYDVGVDARYMQIALKRLDMLVAELHEQGPLPFFLQVPDTVIPIIAGQSTYNFYSSMLPMNSPRLQFVSAAYLRTYTDRVNDPTRWSQRPIQVVPWEDMEDDQTAGPRWGTPTLVFLERKDVTPKLVLDQVPAAPAALPPPAAAPDLTTPHELLLRGYTFAPNIAADRGAGTTGFPVGWGLYLTYRLAADIGAGPVTRLPIGDRDFLLKEAARKWPDLFGRSARANQTDQRVRFHDI